MVRARDCIIWETSGREKRNAGTSQKRFVRLALPGDFDSTTRLHSIASGELKDKAGKQCAGKPTSRVRHVAEANIERDTVFVRTRSNPSSAKPDRALTIGW